MAPLCSKPAEPTGLGEGAQLREAGLRATETQRFGTGNLYLRDFTHHGRDDFRRCAPWRIYRVGGGFERPMTAPAADMTLSVN